MDGKPNKRNTADDPIDKPRYPLPGIFFPSGRCESPTKRRTSVTERAHFYRKGTSESGLPIYGFRIIPENG